MAVTPGRRCPPEHWQVLPNKPQKLGCSYKYYSMLCFAFRLISAIFVCLFTLPFCGSAVSAVMIPPSWLVGMALGHQVSHAALLQLLGTSWISQQWGHTKHEAWPCCQPLPAWLLHPRRAAGTEQAEDWGAARSSLSQTHKRCSSVHSSNHTKYRERATVEEVELLHQTLLCLYFVGTVPFWY